MSGKWRFTFEADFQGTKSKPLICRLASRPVYDEAQNQSFLKGEMYKPEKRQEITTTFFDLADPDLKPLMEIIGKVYKLSADTGSVVASYKDEDAGIGKLLLQLPGRSTCCHCGKPNLNDMFRPRGPLEPLEEWTLGGLWPMSVDFGCCGDDELNIKWSYSTFIYKYLGPVFPPVDAKPQGPPAEPPATPPTVGNGAMSLGTLGCHQKCECPTPDTDSKMPPG